MDVVVEDAELLRNFLQHPRGLMSPCPKEVIVVEFDPAAIEALRLKSGEFPIERVVPHQVTGIESKRCVAPGLFRDIYFLVEEVVCLFQKFRWVRCFRFGFQVQSHLVPYNIRMDCEEGGREERVAARIGPLEGFFREKQKSGAAYSGHSD